MARTRRNSVLYLARVGMWCAVLGSHPSWASTQEDVKAEWRAAYDKLELAAQAQGDGRFGDALDLYEQARALFRGVKLSSPDWNTALVSYRLNYCRQQIATLEQLVREERSKLSREELLKIVTSQTDKIDSLVEKNEEFEHRLELSEQALERARREAARSLLATGEVTELMQEKIALGKKLELADVRITELSERLIAESRESDIGKIQAHFKQQLDLYQAEKEHAGRKIAELEGEKLTLHKQIDEAAAARKELLADKAHLERLVSTHEAALEQQAREMLALTGGRPGTTDTESPSPEERIRQLTQFVDDLQRENRGLQATLTKLRSARPDDRNRTIRELREQIEALQASLQSTKDECAKQAKRAEAQQHLLGQQEKLIASLQEAGTKLENELKAEREAAQSVARIKAKADVVDGLAASLEDADSKLAKANARLGTTIRELERAQQGLREYELLLKQRDVEIKRLRNTVVQSSARERAEPTDGYLAQIADLSEKLMRERERSRALEKSLHQPPVPATVPARTPAEPQPGPADPQLAAKKSALLVRGYLQQGLHAEEKSNYESAVWNYKQTIEIDPENKVALQRLGLLCAEQGNEPDAEEYLHRAFRVDPDDVDTLTALGFCLARQGKAYLAVSMLTRGTVLKPDAAEPHRALGVACARLGWYDTAEAELRRAFEIDGKDSESAFNLAILLATKTPVRMKEARNWYARACEISGESDPGLDELFSVPHAPQSENQ